MMKFFLLILFFPIIFLFSSCSDSASTIQSIGNIILPSSPHSDNSPIYGNGSLAGNQNNPENPENTEQGGVDQEGEDVSEP